MSTKHAKLTRKNLAEYAHISVRCEPEDIPFESNASAIGSKEDAETNWIRAELDNGNQWAWCCVVVTASLADEAGRYYLTGTASLGGCSYESRKAFDDAGETAQLTEEALDDLWRQLELRTPAGRAKALAATSRQAIVTSERTTNGNYRVIARCEAKRISVPWDDNLDIRSNHAAAAQQLMDQLGWSERNDLVMGGTRDGYVFVQVPKRSK